MTPLGMACLGGDPVSVALLLGAGADPRFTRPGVCHQTLCLPCSSFSINLAQTAEDLVTLSCSTAACPASLLNMVLEEGAPLQSESEEESKSPLIRAVMSKDPEKVEVIVNQINECEIFRVSPLYALPLQRATSSPLRRVGDQPFLSPSGHRLWQWSQFFSV